MPTADLPPELRAKVARLPPPVREPPEVRYSLDLDIGEVVDGYHLIVRSISLTDENLFIECAFAPELAEEAEVWPNMNYDADVSPPDWNYVAGGTTINMRGRHESLGTHGSTSSHRTSNGMSIWTPQGLTATTCGTG